MKGSTVTLTGQVAIVTGGTAGLGLAIARQLAAEGATVVCASRSGRLPDAIEPIAGPGRLVADHVDVQLPASVDDLVRRTVATYEGCHLMVANAGVSRDGKVADLPLADWGVMLTTNVSGVLHCIQAVAPHMRAQGGGRIITMSSSMATRPAAGAGGYAATKAAIEALTRAAAIELARHGIAVNALAPGVIDAGLGRVLAANQRALGMYAPRFAAGRPGDGRDVGRVAAWLAGADANYVNGAIIEVNGGMSWA